MSSKGVPESKPAITPKMKPLGILGGGQLARMLALKAHSLGLPVTVLSENPDDPAAQVVSRWEKGLLNDERRLTTFARSCSLLTFESEFLDAAALKRVAAKTGVEIFPRPDHMALIQDRLTQKRLLIKRDIPTADFLPISDQKSAEKAFRHFSGRLVFKQRRFGYDGYGTFVVRSRQELIEFFPQLDRSLPHGFIAEAFVPFERELALMIARSRDGQTIRFPFVETHQEDSRCLWVKGPLRTSRPRENLGSKLERMLSEIGYVGIMGVELFETRTGLVVNELAPRVHNSAHYSLDALTEDQFTTHLKAVLGLALKPPSPLTLGFAMMNLLGNSDREPSWHLPADVHLHWYGKIKNRRARKMGHLTALGGTPEKALAIVQAGREAFKL